MPSHAIITKIVYLTDHTPTCFCKHILDCINNTTLQRLTIKIKYPHVYSAKDCGPLAVPTNGSSLGNLTIFPNKIHFGCDEGFNLRGSHTRHCQANGTWSGNQTFCQGCLMYLLWFGLKLCCCYTSFSYFRIWF